MTAKFQQPKSFCDLNFVQLTLKTGVLNVSICENHIYSSGFHEMINVSIKVFVTLGIYLQKLAEIEV